jgi:hypothetical protein
MVPYPLRQLMQHINAEVDGMWQCRLAREIVVKGAVISGPVCLIWERTTR